jgi:hypothetical protein
MEIFFRGGNVSEATFSSEFKISSFFSKNCPISVESLTYKIGAFNYSIVFVFPVFTPLSLSLQNASHKMLEKQRLLFYQQNKIPIINQRVIFNFKIGTAIALFKLSLTTTS